MCQCLSYDMLCYCAISLCVNVYPTIEICYCAISLCVNVNPTSVICYCALSLYVNVYPTICYVIVLYHYVSMFILPV